jgi:hypothetical protein
MPDEEITPRPDLDRAVVRTAGAVPLARIAAIHVDGADAEPAVKAAALAIIAADLDDEDAMFTVDGAEGFELEWYAAQELSTLTGATGTPD